MGGPNNAPKGEVTRLDASLTEDNRQVFRQTRCRCCGILHSVATLVFAGSVEILLTAVNISKRHVTSSVPDI